jgi:hypothetical protein
MTDNMIGHVIARRVMNVKEKMVGFSDLPGSGWRRRTGKVVVKLAEVY